ncbi:MAG TPA: hypothetical protein VFV70_09155 [Hyphomonadaceae bacterium]|nr:hypothetical protein [Hyphomonadaceae bacterium]
MWVSLALLAPAAARYAAAQAAIVSHRTADIEYRLREAEREYDVDARRYVLGQSLTEDEEARHAFPVERGRTYFGLALCEETCGGIDLVVEDETGNVIDNDETARADPTLLFRADQTGRVTVVVSMRSCGEDACEYGLGFHTLRRKAGRD